MTATNGSAPHAGKLLTFGVFRLAEVAGHD
jgi:hypothetical protein